MQLKDNAKILSQNFHYICDPNADTEMEEQEIDRHVYKLYGLTYDDVKIVDPETPITCEEYTNNK